MSAIRICILSFALEISKYDWVIFVLCSLREEYVNAYIDYIFNTSVTDQFDAFNDGFHKVCGGRVLVSQPM